MKILDILLNKKVFLPVIILLVATILYNIIKIIIKRMFKLQLKKRDIKRHETLKILIINVSKYFIYIIALLMILEVYEVDTKSLIASLGVLSLVAGLALQDTLKDFISGITILTENQYSVGDIVTISGFKGEVIYLGLKTTKIKSYGGDVFMIANRNITEVVNHSLSNSLAIVDVPISYNEDIDKIERILKSLCDKLTKTLNDINGEVTLLGLNNFDTSYMVYKITVETMPEKNFKVQRDIYKEIKKELDKNNIKIPYNQLVIHNG